MNDLTQLDTFLKGLAHFKETAPVTGKPLLKFIKTGQWLLGVNNEPVDEALVAVNPLSIRIGYVAWDNGQVVAESPLIPFTQGWPAVDRSVVMDKGTIAQKYLFEGKLIENDPAIECVYSAATDGGAKAVVALIDEIYKQAAQGSKHLVPVMELSADSYKHPQYGITYKPVFKIDHWCNMEGARESLTPKLAEKAVKRNLV